MLPITRRLFHRMRTEGSGRSPTALSVGIGFFIGCTPFYGFHLLLVLAVGRLLRLNRLKMYIAANVSNPIVAPVLVFAEVQLGAWLRRGELHSLTFDSIRSTEPWTFGYDLLVGSLAVGIVGGIAAGLVTFASSRTRQLTAGFDEIAVSAAARYLPHGIIAWEFARGKLRGDPIYREALTNGLLASGPRLIDIGCGQGLMLAVLAEARTRARAGDWPPGDAVPVFAELFGVELRPRIARLADAALRNDATIISEDAREAHLPAADAILLFDVLHMMPAASQELFLRALASRLSPGGILLVREADAGAGWRFQMVRVGNSVKALVTLNWRQRFAFRSAADWQRTFEAAGFRSEVHSMRAGTPFGNVLFTLAPLPLLYVVADGDQTGVGQTLGIEISTEPHGTYDRLQTRP